MKELTPFEAQTGILTLGIPPKPVLARVGVYRPTGVERHTELEANKYPGKSGQRGWYSTVLLTVLLTR